MPAADFLTAETSTSLSAECAETFLCTYTEAVRLTPLELARLSRLRALMEIGWIAGQMRIAPLCGASLLCDGMRRDSQRMCERFDSARLLANRTIAPSRLVKGM